MGVTLTVLLMLVGMVGIVVPVLPGLLLVAASTAVWAGMHHDGRAWVVVGVCAAVYLVGLVVQYLVPGRRLRGAGVGSWTLALAVVVALVAGVLLPVVGAPVGFVAAIFLVEAVRHRDTGRAWRVTRSALAAVGVSALVELTAAWVIAGTWGVGVLLLGGA